jgi:hypothetical protein
MFGRLLIETPRYSSSKTLRPIIDAKHVLLGEARVRGISLTTTKVETGLTESGRLPCK